MSPLVQFLIDLHGWSWTFKALSGISLILILCSFSYYEPPKKLTIDSDVIADALIHEDRSIMLSMTKLDRFKPSLKTKKQESKKIFPFMKSSKSSSFDHDKRTESSNNKSQNHESPENLQLANESQNNKASFKSPRKKRSEGRSEGVRRKPSNIRVGARANSLKLASSKEIENKLTPSLMKYLAKRKNRSNKSTQSVPFGRHFARTAASSYRSYKDEQVICCGRYARVGAASLLSVGAEPVSVSSIYTNRIFIILCLQSFLLFFSYDTPTLNLPDLAQNYNISSTHSSYLLTFFGATNGLSQVVLLLLCFLCSRA